MDCAVIPLRRHKEYSLVQTVDFFYPLVDDPFIMGQIALANVVSDVYAVGVTNIDNLTMIITSPTELTDKERNTILPMIIDGFNASAKEAGCRVHLNRITINPWCIIGGIATAVTKQNEIIMPSNSKVGDVLVLTKPLGMHLATNSFIWMQEKNENYQKLIQHFNDEDIRNTYKMAIKSMTFLNKTAALLMHKFNASSATDVTGFGLIGHAQNLAEFQKDVVQFKLNALPILKNVLEFGKILNQDKKLRSGSAVETSGGLLITLPAENADLFCKEFQALTNNAQSAWIIGEVVSAEQRNALLIDSPEFIEVDLPF